MIVERVWPAGRPVDVLGTLSPLVRGAGDPAHRVDEAGRITALTLATLPLPQ